MSVSFVTLFLALLALVAQAGVLAALVLWLGRRSPALARLGTSLRDSAGPQAVTMAFAVALTSTLGSLYLSEIAHYVPCKLCWYQRIAMYPLVPILLVAMFRKDNRVVSYVLPLTIIGGSISTYHLLLERFPQLEGAASCDADNPCSAILLVRFGYLTIPIMALSGFALITVLVLVARSWESDSRRLGSSDSGQI
ncbi:MAG: disulfide oxidoreductase [Actinomycetota bacterium]